MFRVFLIMFVFSLAEEGSGFEAKVSHIQMFQENPHLKKCVSTVLHKDDVSGVRASEKAGQCEPILAGYWGRTMERGYAYAKKVVVKKNFQPPADLNGVLGLWRLPGRLYSGARLGMTLQIDKPEEFFFHIRLYGPITITFSFDDGFMFNGRNTDWKMVGARSGRLPAAFTSKEVFKVSILAHYDSVTMLVNDEVFGTFPAYNITQLHSLSLHTYGKIGVISIHRVEFTGI